MIKLGPVLIFPTAEEKVKMGRPSRRTPETVAVMCAAIREHGFTDTHAGARAGVSSSAISRWRQEDEEFAVQLDAARADYLEGRLKEIRETRKRDGSLDWRAQAWLVQAAAPEEYGRPGRRYAAARAKGEKGGAHTEAPADGPNVLSPQDLRHFQQWRAFSLYKKDGVPEDEARWRAHFGGDPGAPVFPGSLEMAGAEIPPPLRLPREEAEALRAIAERSRAARAATAEREARERGEWTGDAGVPESGDEVEGWSGNVGASGDGNDAGVSGRLRPELQKVAKCPESSAEQKVEGAGANEGRWAAGCGSSQVSRADDQGAGVGGSAPASRNGAMCPESRTRAAEETRGEGAPTPWAGAESARGAEAELAQGAEAARRGQVRRPLAGAARAAAEAKEWRGINQQMEEEWERAAWRAQGAAEAAQGEAMLGMQAGF